MLHSKNNAEFQNSCNIVSEHVHVLLGSKTEQDGSSGKTSDVFGKVQVRISAELRIILSGVFVHLSHTDSTIK
jgi:hypothetical protein